MQRHCAGLRETRNLLLRAEELSIPLENMISPEHVRRICWNSPTGSVDQALSELGARPWQREIATPILELALLEKEPLEIAQKNLNANPNNQILLQKFIKSSQQSIRELNDEYKDMWTDPGIKVQLED